MTFGIRHFSFNRKNDWLDSGTCYNVKFQNDCLVIPRVNSQGEKSYYISKVCDSEMNEIFWNRLKLDCSFSENVFTKIYVYTSEKKIACNGVDVEEFLASEKMSVENKILFLEEVGAVLYENCNDVLLFDCKGRYAWFALQVVNYSEKDVYIKDLKIEFPKNSFVDYLPEIYQKSVEQDSFLERFVGVFQSLYLDLDEQITNIPMIFNPKTVDFEFLNCLVEWMSLKHPHIWGKEKLRVVLKEAISLYKIKGTRQVISKVVELYTGEAPIIIEKIHIEDTDFCKNNKELSSKLYGENGCFFCVFVRRDVIKESNDYANLLKIIDDFKPIDTVCNLVVLSQEIFLDHHCYLELNSRISGNHNMVLKDNEYTYALGVLV